MTIRLEVEVDDDTPYAKAEGIRDAALREADAQGVQVVTALFRAEATAREDDHA